MHRAHLHGLMAVLMLSVALNFYTLAVGDRVQESGYYWRDVAIEASIQRDAARETLERTRTVAMADRDILRACRTRIKIAQVRRWSDNAMMAIKGAEYYRTSAGQYAQAVRE